MLSNRNVPYFLIGFILLLGITTEIKMSSLWQWTHGGTSPEIWIPVRSVQVWALYMITMLIIYISTRASFSHRLIWWPTAAISLAGAATIAAALFSLSSYVSIHTDKVLISAFSLKGIKPTTVYYDQTPAAYISCKTEDARGRQVHTLSYRLGDKSSARLDLGNLLQDSRHSKLAISAIEYVDTKLQIAKVPRVLYPTSLTQDAFTNCISNAAKILNHQDPGSIQKIFSPTDIYPKSIDRSDRMKN